MANLLVGLDIIGNNIYLLVVSTHVRHKSMSSFSPSQEFGQTSLSGVIQFFIFKLNLFYNILLTQKNEMHIISLFYCTD